MPPVFVTVSGTVCLFPTVSLPKEMLVGFDPNVPTVTPVPDSGIVKVGFDAFEVTVTLPLTAPAEVGANDTLNVALCPDGKVTGVVIPVKVNPVPLTAT